MSLNAHHDRTSGACRCRHGRGVDDQRSTRPRARGRSDRPDRGRRGRVVAPGLGRRPVPGGGSAAAGRLHPCHLRNLRAARDRDGPDHNAVHGGVGPHPHGHGQRAGVPRTARGGGGQWKRPRSLGVAGAGRRRRPGVDPTLAGRHRRRRRGLRAGCGGLLGGLHPADPARRRPGEWTSGSGGLDAGSRRSRHGDGRRGRAATDDSGHDPHRPRVGAAAADRAVHPRTAGAASPERRGVRHVDESGTRAGVADRISRPASGAQRGRDRRDRVRRGRRDRRRPPGVRDAPASVQPG